MWRSVLDRLEASVDARDFNSWIRPLKCERNDETLHLFVPNRYAYDKIQNNFLDQIADVATSVYGKEMVVDLELPRKNHNSHFAEAKPKRHNGAAKLPFGQGHLNPAFTLEEYVLGESNKFAYHAAESVSENPGSQHANPLFIYGSVGIGKTHLMQAVGHRMMELNSHAKVGYVQSSNYVEHLLRYFRKKDSDAVEKFKAAYRSLDVLLVDDVHLFAGATHSQNEFFNTFNQLLELNKQIIITCNQYYRELDQVERGLKSRFGQGIVAPVYEPEFEHRINILRAKAEKRRIDLGDEVTYFIAEKVKPDVRELEGALNLLIAHHRFLGHAITIDVAKKVLRDMLRYNSRPLELQDIVQIVANYYSIRIEDITGKSRKANLCRARHMAMMLARELTTKSLQNIAKFFGNRDHASVLHACKKINSLVDADSTDFDSKTFNEYSTLKKTLNN